MSLEERVKKLEDLCRYAFGTTDLSRFKEISRMAAELSTIPPDSPKFRYLVETIEELKKLG